MPSSPSRPRPDLAFLTARPYAHRGLHGAGGIENSPSAFAAAIRAGHGIELDVQLTSDGEAAVFHDTDLKRLTGSPGRLADHSAAELAAIRLIGGTDTIPTLRSVLELIGGQAPLLIEIKTPGRECGRLCRAVARALAGYQGPVAVMGFNPQVARWFRRHAPDIAHGLVVSEEGPKTFTEKLVKAAKRIGSVIIARPDFLAYDVRSLASSLPRRLRAHGVPVLTWTVRTPADRERAETFADQIIYETT